MKTSVGKVSVVAACVSILPLVSEAQNIASRPALVDRSVERLTLLPGPNLLSPARHSPSMAPGPLKLGAAPTFFFMPYGTPLFNTQGATLAPLLPGRVQGVQPSIRAIPGERPGTLQLMDPFRFDHSFKAPVPESRWHYEPGPRRL